MEIDQQHWAARPLDRAALDNLHHLNRDFFERLVWSFNLRPEGPARSPAARIGAGLARLAPAQRAELARSPFAFFDGRFSDGAFWSRVTGMVREGPLRAQLSISGNAVFAEPAVSYAWHLSRLDPMAARLMLGMSDRTQSVFAGLTLPFLQQLVIAQPDLMAPRWAGCAAVWRTLWSAARSGLEPLSHARQLGIQLISGERSASLRL